MTDGQPYGTWESPLSAAQIAAGSLRLLDVCVDGDDIYWVEGRATEQGRCVVVRRRDGALRDVIPAPYTARTSVHEYGGAAIAAHAGVLYFNDARSGRICVVRDDEAPRPLTATDTALRFADFIVDAGHDRLIAVCEDHAGDAVVNSIVAIALSDGTVTPLVSGADFYSSPRLSPGGDRLAWICWDFPLMPWDGTALWCADVSGDGGLDNVVQLGGGPEESVVEPLWSPGGDLFGISDRSGWWNLCRAGAGGLAEVERVPLECARPHWNFGQSAYAFIDATHVAICGAGAGRWQMRIVDTGDGTARRLDLPFTEMGTHVLRAGDAVLIDGGGPADPTGLHLVDPRSGAVETIWRSAASPLAPEWIATPESVEFPTPDGATGHAFLYRPTNPSAHAPDGELPPLLVRAHGGPTSAARTSLSLEVQYWTSRGFAVCDVNYGGSTGYGRAYRERLHGTWGCVDVDDCVAAAVHLAREGICDGSRMCITGGSAGGYVVLCALVFVPDVFAAATSYYGVSDVEALDAETHKFEARYSDWLIGPAATHASLRHNRSPIHFVSRIRTPVLLLQGTDDPVVPISQAETVVAALRENGVRHAYITFAGEQHGFRQAASIERALEAELAFYGHVLGFVPADDLPPVAVEGAHQPT